MCSMQPAGGMNHELEVCVRHTIPQPDGTGKDVLLRAWALDMRGMVNYVTVGTYVW